MKTLLPASIQTTDQAAAFIRDLHLNGEFFHLDDDATDIINGHTRLPLFTQEEGEKINDLLQQAFAICDVWELPIISTILEELNKD